MLNISSQNAVRELLKKHCVAPHKQLGQNFLFDANILDKIINAADIAGECVLEIGPGLGHLTQRLAQSARQVVAVEIDAGFLSVLNSTLDCFTNVEVVHADFLKADLAELGAKLGGGSFCVCANLPYYITTPIIMRILESELDWKTMCLLVQKEVAERIAAKPDNKNYGSLSVAVQYYADASVELKVPAGCFYPTPQVESLVVKLTKRDAPFEVKNTQLYFKVVRAAFAMRRKKLSNNLMQEFSLSRQAVEDLLNECGIDLNLRGEALPPSDFALISNAIASICQ